MLYHVLNPEPFLFSKYHCGIMDIVEGELRELQYKYIEKMELLFDSFHDKNHCNVGTFYSGSGVG